MNKFNLVLSFEAKLIKNTVEQQRRFMKLRDKRIGCQDGSYFLLVLILNRKN